MRIVLMCPRCGFIRTPKEDNHSYDVCECCQTNTKKVDFDVELFTSARTEDEITALKERVWRKHLYNNPQFDEETFEKRLVDEKKSYDEAMRKISAISALNEPKCPYCNSFYVEKISTAGRLLSTALFGLGSSKVGKQWHCKQCGSNF